MSSNHINRINSDVILVGTGIMSATLGIFLKLLDPSIKISIFESLDQPALESTDAWNNAGTGHAAFCELNYTPQKENGDVDIKKALNIAENFEVTRQFWSYLVENNIIQNPEQFIKKTPHLSFVWGEENVDFLRKRFQLLKENALFSEMLYSESFEQLLAWMPLVMNGRDSKETLAATFMKYGTDVNFGKLSESIFEFLQKQEGVHIFYNHKVRKLKQRDTKVWRLKIKDTQNNIRIKAFANFVFIGAGGGSLLLLENANIKEGEGYGGFPVSGQWLKCNNPDIIQNHAVKVYGKASVGAPPMSVPHLDSRIINGKKELLFGPFAGFSTKFLKNGSYMDLIKSIEINNMLPMLSAGFKNVPLTKYLIQQVMQSQDDRIAALREYFPEAKSEDWELLQAGQRVQVIKKDEKEGGVLEFGTEIISSSDGTLAALLGASPGASTAVSIMIDVLNKCFADKMQSESWTAKLTEIIPSFGKLLNENPELLATLRAKTNQILKLND